jgi:hypothetical protein
VSVMVPRMVVIFDCATASRERRAIAKTKNAQRDLNVIN